MILVHAGDPYDMSRIGLECPPLPFATDALEVAGISRENVAKHYGQHQAYCRNTQRIVQDLRDYDPDLEDVTLLSAFRWAASRRDPMSSRATFTANDLFEQAGQAWNHAFFWLSLRSKAGQTRLSSRDEFQDSALGHMALVAGHESLRDLQEWIIDAAEDSFGSQWAWLTFADGELGVVVTDGADSPIVKPGVMPLLVVDLWEHAYFGDYVFKRAEYAKELVTRALNWDRANALLTLELCD